MVAALLQEALERMTGASFDSCLLNLYRDGGDHMGWHSDNESLYGREPTIGDCARPLLYSRAIFVHTTMSRLRALCKLT